MNKPTNKLNYVLEDLHFSVNYVMLTFSIPSATLNFDPHQKQE